MGCQWKMDILLSGELYNSHMKALARFLELKGHKRSAGNTKKIWEQLQDSLPARKVDFWQTLLAHFIRSSPAPHVVTSLRTTRFNFSLQGNKRHEQLLPWDIRESRRRNQNRAHREMQQIGICSTGKRRVEESRMVHATFTWIDTFHLPTLLKTTKDKPSGES